MNISNQTNAGKRPKSQTMFLAFALFAYLLQAIIPVGFMPGSVGKGTGFVSLCPSGPLYYLAPENAPQAASSAHAAQEQGHHHHHMHHQPMAMGLEGADDHAGHSGHLAREGWNSDCVFGSLAGSAEYTLPLFYAYQIFASARNEIAAYTRSLRVQRLTLRPPVRAPPFFLV